MAGKVKPHHILSEQGVRKAIGTAADLPTPLSAPNMAATPSVNNVEGNKTIIKEQPMEVN